MPSPVLSCALTSQAWHIAMPLGERGIHPIFSARALFGLLGDDDFRVKVSPDGSAYFDAILMDRNSGRVELPKPTILPGVSSAPAAPASPRRAAPCRRAADRRRLRPAAGTA